MQYFMKIFSHLFDFTPRHLSPNFYFIHLISTPYSPILYNFSYDDGEYEITFNIVDINFFAKTITVAITRCGKITQDIFSLLRDKDGKLYFEFGRFYENKIHLDDFDEVN